MSESNSVQDYIRQMSDEQANRIICIHSHEAENSDVSAEAEVEVSDIETAAVALFDETMSCKNGMWQVPHATMRRLIKALAEKDLV